MSTEPSPPTPRPAVSTAPRPRARGWVVFSTFDRAGRSSGSAVEQVQAYRESGLDVLVVDTSAEPSAERRADWDREATCWFQRPNIGYDFGSFKAGLSYLVEHQGLRDSGQGVLIANDSCFGPFVPLRPIIEAFDALPRDGKRVLGITDSLQECHHIQSYWIYFRADVLHLALEFFLVRMVDAKDREEAIRHGEIALGEFLLARGCILDAVCPVHDTLARLARFNGWLPSVIELGVRRLLKRWKYSQDLDTQCLRNLLHYPDKIKYFNPIVLFGVPLHCLDASPFLKKSMFRDNVYRDPAIPPGLDPTELTNAQVFDLFRDRRKGAFRRRSAGNKHGVLRNNEPQAHR